MNLDDITDQLKGEGEKEPITCIKCGVEFDVDTFVNHFGPERAYDFANEILKIVMDDFNNALSQ